MADVVVDARDRHCPEPTIMLDRAAAAASPGQTIELLATDRGVLLDIPAWVGDHGHDLLEEYEDGGAFHFVIELR